MLPNGRVERTREERVGRLVAAITGIYLVLLFLIPIFLVSNSVPELSGRANRIDYATEDGWGSWGNQNNGLNDDILSGVFKCISEGITIDSTLNKGAYHCLGGNLAKGGL